MADAGFEVFWQMYDIDTGLQQEGAVSKPAKYSVELRDSIANFPSGFQTAITNPPYLSFHFAKRKGLNPTKEYFEGFDSLYQTSIERALANCDFVAMIIPESFITSGLFTGRLQSVISLPFAMFDDTDMPTCLALWGIEPSVDFQIWRGDDLLGNASELTQPLVATDCKKRISFNDPAGNIGLRAIDNSTAASIWFCPPDEIPIEKVKHSARLLTRIQVDNLKDPERLIRLANLKINNWRDSTQDVSLTAFKGVRKDGRFRRRLDYANARALLSQALCELENHQH